MMPDRTRGSGEPFMERIPSTDNRKKKGGKSMWAVWRQDDNGHRFLVSVMRTQAQALKERESYERLGHKQCYWIESHQG